MYLRTEDNQVRQSMGEPGLAGGPAGPGRQPSAGPAAVRGGGAGSSLERERSDGGVTRSEGQQDNSPAQSEPSPEGGGSDQGGDMEGQYRGYPPLEEGEVRRSRAQSGDRMVIIERRPSQEGISQLEMQVRGTCRQNHECRDWQGIGDVW